jgi:hypothetical protein
MQVMQKFLARQFAFFNQKPKILNWVRNDTCATPSQQQWTAAAAHHLVTF